MIGRRGLFLAIMYCGNIVKTTSGAGHVLNHGIYFVYIDFVYIVYIFLLDIFYYIYIVVILSKPQVGQGTC